jgi:hypothetical protein
MIGLEGGTDAQNAAWRQVVRSAFIVFEKIMR